MSRPLEAIACTITDDLADADELLTKYGRWAMNRYRKQHCASAEGRYRIPPNEDDRQPREVLLPTPDAMRVQRALSRVPDLERIVLAILYIPQRLPAQAQLRLLRIPPRTSRERHRAGLVMFRNLHRLMQ